MEGAVAHFLSFAPDIHREAEDVEQISSTNTMYGAAPAIQPQHLVPWATRPQAVNVAERTPLAAFLWMLRQGPRGRGRWSGSAEGGRRERLAGWTGLAVRADRQPDDALLSDAIATAAAKAAQD